MRLESLDFLRGIAIILVLFAHRDSGIPYLRTVGWVGVDLFFVLSGFLVSGLLFREYASQGAVSAKRFLVRRGFKIYPLFYVSYILTICLILFIGLPQYESLNWKGRAITLVSESVFLQNYFGTFWGHHWSLAVEEHFYFLIALLFPFFINKPKQFLWVFPLSFTLRAITQILWPETGFHESHLRMDSLAMGVVISYVHHFGDLRSVYERYKPWMFAALFFPLLFIFDSPLESFWIKTVGFSLLYISFGSLLIVLLHEKFTYPKLVTKIGYYSYGVYLFHLYWATFLPEFPYSFLVYFLGAVVCGAFLSWLIEKPFLRMRDRLLPR